VTSEKGFVIFTAKSQRTLREMFFSFPMRGRKVKILDPFGNDILFGDRQSHAVLIIVINLLRFFSFAGIPVPLAGRLKALISVHP
jgi:hypothetical protein